MALIANKNDLYEENQMVMDEEGEEVAKKYGIDFLTTSAKISSKSFQDFVNKLLLYIQKNTLEVRMMEKIFKLLKLIILNIKITKIKLQKKSVAKLMYI